MKKFIIPLIGIALLASACSQERLDIEQKGVVSTESFYNGSDESCQSAVTAMYDKAISTTGNWRIYVPLNYLFSCPGDDMYSGGGSYGDCDYAAELSEFRVQVNNDVLTNFYGESYQIIYTANLVTDNFPEPKNAYQKDLVAQARAMRAIYHMYLALAVGTPPIVDHVLAGGDKPENSESQAAVLKWAAEELESAANDLTERASTADKALTYRISKGAALAFAGRCRLYMKDYSGAKTDLEKVINSGKYDLLPSERFHELWEVEGDGSAEKIFEYNIDENTAIATWGSGITAQIVHSTWMAASSVNWRFDHMAGTPSIMFTTGWGFSNPTGKYGDALIDNDGIDSYRRKAFIRTYAEVLGLAGSELNIPGEEGCEDCNLHYDDEPTTYAGKLADPNRGSNTAAGMFDIEGGKHSAGYFNWKTIALQKDMRQGLWDDRNYHLMRYAEVLLMYAECCVQTNSDLAKGLEALNKIQKRAGSNHISSSLTLQEVKNEKFLELFNEGCRWNDLVRWGDAEKEYANMRTEGGKTLGTGDYQPYLRDRMFTDGAATHQGYTYIDYDKGNTVKHGYQTGRNELFPFPFSATSVNTNLVQNPGY